MRLLAAVVVVVPALGHAGPLTAGVGLGLTQAKLEAGSDPNHTLGLFGRLGLTSRIAGQLELQRIQTADQTVDLRELGALIVVDLVPGNLVPVILAGAGYDHASTPYGGTDAHHIEGGFGLEYRARGGLSIGFDVRMGGRSIDSQSSKIVPVGIAACAQLDCGAPLPDGEYRSVRLAIGVRF